MLNRYQKDPAEFKRIVDIVTAGMTRYEVEDVLNHNIYAFAKALGVRHTGRRRLLARRIHAELQNDKPVSPIVPNADVPTVIHCDGCRGIDQVDGLRWEKLNRGEPFTWSINRTGQPASSAFTDFEIQKWFMVWADLSGFKVRKVTGVGDCHIQFKRIDGPGKVLGFVYQPNGTAEEMASSGNLSGDMFIDNSERSWPIGRTRRFGKHEVGHVFGLQHSESTLDLMYAYLLASTDLNPQRGDVSQWRRRYIDLRQAPNA